MAGRPGGGEVDTLAGHCLGCSKTTGSGATELGKRGVRPQRHWLGREGARPEEPLRLPVRVPTRAPATRWAMLRLLSLLGLCLEGEAGEGRGCPGPAPSSLDPCPGLGSEPPVCPKEDVRRGGWAAVEWARGRQVRCGPEQGLFIYWMG
jgi:hypothetical protein